MYQLCHCLNDIIDEGKIVELTNIKRHIPNRINIITLKFF